jgi:hypothetical protein
MPGAVLAILGREIERERSKMLVEIFGLWGGCEVRFVHTAFTNGGSPPD